MYIPTNNSPGTNAPRNISPADVDPTSNTDGICNSPVESLYNALRAVDAWSVAEASWSARIIKTIDGGMI